MRSPNYPAVSLSEAVTLAQALWNREKRSYAPPGAVVQSWGYAGLSGNARTKIAALRKYGLLEESDHGDLRLSDLAVHILHGEQDSQERLDALREAALKPELFSELQQTHRDASEETLRSYLMTRRGFTDTGAAACVEAFRGTQEIAKLREMEPAAQANISRALPQPSGTPAGRRTQQVAPVPPPTDDSVTTFRWPLSRGVAAEVRFIGEVKAAHLDLLKQYLDVAKGAMELDAAVEEPNL